MKPAELQPLRGDCANCDTPDAVWLHDPGDYFCPACAQQQAVIRAAESAMRNMFRDALHALHATYAGTPAMKELHCQVGWMMQEIADEVAEELNVSKKRRNLKLKSA